MKTKLLKRIRNKYTIEYCPLGVTVEGHILTHPRIVIRANPTREIIDSVFILTEKDIEDREYYRKNGIHHYKSYNDFFMLEDAKERAYNLLCDIIQEEYCKYGTRRNKLREIREREAAQRRLDGKLHQESVVEKLWWGKV